MTDYKTMRVPAEAWEVANDSKREGETWGEFLRRCSDTPPTVREFVDAREVLNRLDELPEETARKTEERVTR